MDGMSSPLVDDCGEPSPAAAKRLKSQNHQSQCFNARMNRGSRDTSERSPVPIRSATTTSILLFLLMPDATAQTLRCETEGHGTDWMQVSPDEGWREWEGSAWGPSLCGRQVQSSHLVEDWQCRFGRQHHVLTYTLTDRHSGGVYRREEMLEPGSGVYHLRIDDGTHVPDGGKCLKLEFSGRCVAVDAMQ